MSGGSIIVSPILGIVLAVLAAVAAATVWFGQLTSARSVIIATIRAVAQLALVSLIIVAVLRSSWLTALFVGVMFGVAALTSAGRIGNRRATGYAAAAIGTGVAPVLLLITLTGVVPAKPIAIVPMAGIIIGGAMTATSLAGRRALDELRNRHGEYEAALSIGLVRREAALEICRPSAGQALIPALDQTRTVGVVTLPGAFVGVLLGGASPIQAGATQLLVLIGLLAAESLAVLVTVYLVASGCISRAESTKRSAGAGAG